jgi:hypothetical protein
MHEWTRQKKILLALVILVFVFNLVILIPGRIRADVQELLWQRVFWGCREDGFNKGIFSMAVYKGKLCVGTLNLVSGGEIWCFDGREWKKLRVEEIPFEELPLWQRTLLRAQEANPKIIVPTLALAAVANVLSAVSLSSLLPYLSYLFQLLSEPLLYFGRKKRKWGVVYDSLTKQPVDLAIVRLFDSETKKLVETRVTNREGKYLFIAELGKEYYISVIKPGYVFPTKLLATAEKDKEYTDLYHGQPFKTGEERKSGFIAYNIPIDPQAGIVKNAEFNKPLKAGVGTLGELQKLGAQAEQKELKRAVWSNRFRKFNRTVAYLGPILALGSFILTPSLLTFGFLLLHIVLLLLFRRLAMGRKAAPWGRVFNIKTSKSLPNSVVRLFDTEYGRLLSVYVTKADGDYGFLVGEDEEYSLVSSKKGYVFPAGQVRVIGQKEVKKDLPMREES